MAIRLSSENRGSVNMELDKTSLAARYAQEAKTASESAQAAAVHPPVIGGNGNWQIWYQGSGYVDSGVHAEGPAGPQGPQRPDDAENVKVSAQTFTDAQKAQARGNIDAANANLYADNGVTITPEGHPNTDTTGMSIVLAAGDPSKAPYEYSARSSIILGPGRFNASNALALSGNATVPESVLTTLPWLADYVEPYPGYPQYRRFYSKIATKTPGNAVIGTGQTFECGFIYGAPCVATGGWGITAGTYTYNTHNYSYVFGPYLLSCKNSSMVCGIWNNPVANDVFEVGNGASASSRTNALRVTTDGKVIAQNALCIEKGDGTQVTVTAAQLEALLALLE